jgi:hypothetical protein
MNNQCYKYDTCGQLIQGLSKWTRSLFYHHSIVPLFGWVLLTNNLIRLGSILFALINLLIHVVMHSYYALSAMGPIMQKYITVMPLRQFFIYGIYAIILFFFQIGYSFILVDFYRSNTTTAILLFVLWLL